MRANVLIGSPKAEAENFFRKAEIEWTEFPARPAIARPNSLVAWESVKTSLFVTTSVGVIFRIGADQTVEEITVLESHTGL